MERKENNGLKSFYCFKKTKFIQNFINYIFSFKGGTPILAALQFFIAFSNKRHICFKIRASIGDNLFIVDECFPANIWWGQEKLDRPKSGEYHGVGSNLKRNRFFDFNFDRRIYPASIYCNKLSKFFMQLMWISLMLLKLIKFTKMICI